MKFSDIFHMRFANRLKQNLPRDSDRVYLFCVGALGYGKHLWSLTKIINISDMYMLASMDMEKY